MVNRHLGKFLLRIKFPSKWITKPGQVHEVDLTDVPIHDVILGVGVDLGPIVDQDRTGGQDHTGDIIGVDLIQGVVHLTIIEGATVINVRGADLVVIADRTTAEIGAIPITDPSDLDLDLCRAMNRIISLSIGRTLLRLIQHCL